MERYQLASHKDRFIFFNSVLNGNFLWGTWRTIMDKGMKYQLAELLMNNYPAREPRRALTL
jgi:hypothetical protein